MKRTSPHPQPPVTAVRYQLFNPQIGMAPRLIRLSGTAVAMLFLAFVSTRAGAYQAAAEQPEAEERQAAPDDGALQGPAPQEIEQRGNRPPPDKTFSRGVLIRFEGPIGPMLQQYFYRKLAQAEKSGADLVIVEIESPGGLRDVSVEIAEKLSGLSWAHTVAYVPREAISGAAVVALGCDEILLRPEAQLGDVGMIAWNPEEAAFRHVPEKVRSVLVSEVRTLAEAHGRPPALAEAMVDMDLVVYEVKNAGTGERAFMSQDEIDASGEPDQWQIVKPVLESREKTFLTVSGRRAVELTLAEAVVADVDELRARYGVGDLQVLRPSGVDTAVYVLNHPVVAWLLLVAGLAALLVELNAPGISIGGLTAGLCFTLFFWSRFLGGTAGWLEVILFAAGAVFLAMEVFVIPGFGIAGISGLLLMGVSLVLASQRFVVPGDAQQWETFGMSLLVVVGAGVAMVLAVMVLVWRGGKIPILSQLALAPPTAAPAASGKDVLGKPLPRSDENSLGIVVGDIGRADSPLRPSGKAMFGDLFVDVVTEGSYVDAGSSVRVISIAGNRVVVREVEV